MHYELTAAPDVQNNACLVIGIFGDRSLPDFAVALDKQKKGLITRLATKLSEHGDSTFQADIDGHSLLLIHCGDKQTFSAQHLNKRLHDLTNFLCKQRITHATLCLPNLAERSADWQVQQMILQIETACYQLLTFKSQQNKQHALQSISIFMPTADSKSIAAGQAIAQGVNFTRTLANLPANVCTPTYLAEQAHQLVSEHAHFHAKILNAADMHALGMHALLAVAQGSEEPPHLIELQYLNGGDSAPVVLVGKGITFDSGGLSLKPADAMTEMKYDMAGAAAVLGTLKACALLKLPINVVGLIASAENMPSGSAMKPGDIVTSMSGQTIEIINTDAEGRMVLADALTYAEQFNPRFVIDVATLTGAVLVALGHVNSGFMTTDEPLAEIIQRAAFASDDKVWRLPLEDAYQDALDSPIADMVNATFNRVAGSITAACFLSRFTKKYPWAHLDIAGTAWISGKNRNATGRPVPLLIELLSYVAHSR